MADANFSPLVLKETRNFAGLTTDNHLMNAYLKEPEKMEGVMAWAFGTTNNTVLSFLTGGLGNTRFVASKQYEWDVHGQTEIAVDLVRASTDGGVTPGIGGSPVRIFAKENIFESTDNLRLDDGTMVRVQSEPYVDGNAAVLTVILVDTDKDFIDPNMLIAGAKISKLYSTVEEGSVKGGGTHYSTPTTLINQLTTLRKHIDVTRNAAKSVMTISLPDPANPKKTTRLWTKMAEWTALAQWQKEIDRSMIYTQFNSSPVATVHIQGETKRPVFHGAGLRQQISPANVQNYTKLTYAQLDDYFTDLSYAAEAWGGDTNFVGLTGKMGMREFNQAIKDEQAAQGITVTNAGTFITGEGTELTFQGQFTRVKLLNGVTVTMKIFNPYDDIVHNRTLHPISGKPTESYRMTFLNFGRKDGLSNIRKVALTDSENAMWNVSGSVDPMGGVVKGIAESKGSSRDGYRVEMLGEVGIQMQDPTSSGELIYEVA